jgi:hypothetical protein
MTGRWIGRDELIAWPPGPPYLTPLDLFLWGYVKNTVYQFKINELQHLEPRTRDAVATVIPNMLQATWNEVEYRLDICRTTKGAHTCNYWESYIHRKKNFDSFPYAPGLRVSSTACGVAYCRHNWKADYEREGQGAETKHLGQAYIYE